MFLTIPRDVTNLFLATENLYGLIYWQIWLILSLFSPKEITRTVRTARIASPNNHLATMAAFVDRDITQLHEIFQTLDAVREQMESVSWGIPKVSVRA